MMKQNTVPEWKHQLMSRISSHVVERSEGVEVERDFTGIVTGVLEFTRYLVTIIPEAVSSIEIVDRNKYDFLLDNLENILSFENFSLAEYTYRSVAGPKRRPGLRLWYEKGVPCSTIKIVLFDDVLAWRVDHRGNKLSETLLILTIEECGKLSVSLDCVDQDGDAADWRRSVFEAFCAPLQRYFTV